MTSRVYVPLTWLAFDDEFGEGLPPDAWLESAEAVGETVGYAVTDALRDEWQGVPDDDLEAMAAVQAAMQSLNERQDEREPRRRLVAVVDSEDVRSLGHGAVVASVHAPSQVAGFLTDTAQAEDAVSAVLAAGGSDTPSATALRAHDLRWYAREHVTAMLHDAGVP